MANVLEKNKKLKTVSKVSTFALKLARESIFSPAVMAQCTPSGDETYLVYHQRSYTNSTLLCSSCFHGFGGHHRITSRCGLIA